MAKKTGIEQKVANLDTMQADLADDMSKAALKAYKHDEEISKLNKRVELMESAEKERFVRRERYETNLRTEHKENIERIKEKRVLDINETMVSIARAASELAQSQHTLGRALHDLVNVHTSVFSSALNAKPEVVFPDAPNCARNSG